MSFSFTSDAYAHFNDSLGMVFGSLTYSNPVQDGIQIPSSIPKQTQVTVIIQDYSSHELFKTCLLQSSVHPITCIVKDSHNKLLNVYHESRKNNQSGDVFIYSPSCFFFKDIVLGLEHDKRIIIGWTNYEPFRQCYTVEAKKQILESDIHAFHQRYGSLKNVILFISSSLHALFVASSLDSFFHSVHVSDMIPNAIAQYVMGSTISHSHPSFDAEFEFGTSNQVLYSKFTNKKIPFTTSSNQVRKNGKLMVTMPGENGVYEFIIIFKKKDGSLLEPFTEIKESTCAIQLSLLKDIPEKDISFLLQEYYFFTKLNHVENRIDFLQTIDCLHHYMNYTITKLDTLEKRFDDYNKNDSLSCLIRDFAFHVHDLILFVFKSLLEKKKTPVIDNYRVENEHSLSPLLLKEAKTIFME